MSVGGYVSAFLTTHYFPGAAESGSSFYLTFLFFGSLLMGGTAAGLVGYCVGLPSLRLKGDYLAIVTLGFGEMIRVMILNLDAVGGARGLPNIPGYSHFGWVYTWVLICTFVIWRLVHSPYGRGFLAVREDEIAAEAMGVNTTRVKVRAFVVGAFFSGVAGGLFAHTLRYLNPQTFDFNRSFEIIIMVVLGGMGSISGSVVAALFLTSLKELLRPLQDWTQIDFRMVIYSLMLIIMMLIRPQGLFGTRELREVISDLGRNRRRPQAGGVE
jgi:branched-chain amino acid transport system permease protein